MQEAHAVAQHNALQRDNLCLQERLEMERARTRQCMEDCGFEGEAAWWVETSVFFCSTRELVFLDSNLVLDPRTCFLDLNFFFFDARFFVRL